MKKPIAWLRILDLEISIRWVQGEAHMDILRGNHWVTQQLPLVERASVEQSWTDNADVYREANAWLRSRHPKWYRTSGPLEPPPDTVIRSASFYASQQPERQIRKQRADDRTKGT